MKKITKFGLFFLVVSIAIVGLTCKKVDTGSEDVAIATEVLQSIMMDIFGFGGSLSVDPVGQVMSYEGGSMCKQIHYYHENINLRPNGIVNPTPGHGLIQGWYDGWIESNCSVRASFLLNMNCTLGAKHTSGANLGGNIHLDGICTVNPKTMALDLKIKEYSGSTGFEVNGHTYTVDVTCHMWGTASHGTISITGHIGPVTISEHGSY